VNLRNTRSCCRRRAIARSACYLDLDRVWVGTQFSQGFPVGDGLLRAVRIGQNTERAGARGCSTCRTTPVTACSR
jgi:hypothetical protein